jgi:hypothetical protein
MSPAVTREQVLRFRVHVQQLHRAAGCDEDADVLDLGVQETGPDGARWALEIRGARPGEAATFLTWTLRGAPHCYRRHESAGVAAAVAPWTDRDAARRVFDAAGPLRAAGVSVLDALDQVAEQMRDLVQEPTAKGEVSTRLTERLPDHFLRRCRPCKARHLYEQTFRLAALRAGLELQPGTSPPVLQRIPGWSGPADEVPPHLDLVRASLHLLGPATPRLVADFLDSPVAEVKEHWPPDISEVVVDGETRWVLAADLPVLLDPPSYDGLVRLLGPFDLFLQARDRDLIVPDAARRPDLWRVLGRPGGVLVGHELRGTWRPRSSGSRLRLAVEAWGGLPDLTEQAERLVAFRGVTFGGFVP